MDGKSKKKETNLSIRGVEFYEKSSREDISRKNGEENDRRNYHHGKGGMLMLFWSESGIIPYINHYGFVVEACGSAIKGCIVESFQDFLDRANALVDENIEGHKGTREQSLMKMRTEFHREFGMFPEFGQWHENEI